MPAGRASHPVRLESPAGLLAEINANGSIRRFRHGEIVINAFPASEVEGGPANIWLRRRNTPGGWLPLLGPDAGVAVQLEPGRLVLTGEWQAIRFRVALVLAAAAPAWFWHVRLENVGTAPVTVDLIHGQDVALAPWGAIRMNEYYVSQYLDLTPLTHPTYGVALAVRQNQAMGGAHPWVTVGALGRGVSFATDALQLFGLAARAGDPPAGLVEPALAGVRLQHEHAMAVLQDAALSLAPGAAADRGFFGWFEPDHPEATSPGDAATIDRALALPEARPPATAGGPAGTPPVPSLFTAAPTLPCHDLTAIEIAGQWGPTLRHVERDGDTLLSFFTGARTHVALRAKELRILRPHGALLRTGDTLVPDEPSLTTTAWMAGVFNSLVTQGHVSINRFLSTTRSYLGLLRAGGQRIFVETPDGYRLLDVPSAWETTPDGCRWLYAHAGGLIEVRTRAATTHHALALQVVVLTGPPCRFLVSHQVALGGDDGADPVPVRFSRDGPDIVVHPPPDSDVGRRFPDGAFRIAPGTDTPIERVGGDELLFADGRSRDQAFLVLVTAPTTAAAFRITGELLPSPAGAADDEHAADRFWTAMAGPLALAADPQSPLAADAAHLREIVPWYAHDALIHYLAPRGLEQYSGGGWGTRDVSQGPVELLLALGRWAPLRELLLTLFANQNPDGDWPQWFMFFDRERTIRPGDSHGDIVFWPVLALAQYVLAAGDAALLDVAVPFFHPEGTARAEHAPLRAHVERALAVMNARLIPGTHLAAYGHGDWNDSLQPVDPAMRERLCSAWTVTLHHQTLVTLAAALRQAGRGADAAPLEALVPRIRADFQRHLIAGGTLAGFGYFHPDGRVEHWLHPDDRVTGISYRLLPMIHAILADLFTPEQATTHVELIRTHLLGADGARLFDRPPVYRGGPQRHFQRAESSTFFGREIGLMYTHAHLRFAEAMAHWGDADAFFHALRQANPIALDAVVPQARRRQANCYYSSSDAAVGDRYEAAARYPEVRAGKVPVEGGWRVYSSGAGIAVRLVHECLLGLRRGTTALGIDPAVPKALDGLRARVEIDGRPVTVLYRVARTGCGPTAVVLNGQPLPFARGTNPYRSAGVTVPMAVLRERLGERENELRVELE